jgi:hypothetical protein
MEQPEQISCSRCKKYYPTELFINMKTKKTTKQCLHCREKQKINEQIKIKENVENFCKTCKKQYDTSEEFIENNKIYKTCTKCRSLNRKLESTRPQRDRKEYDRSEKRKEKKQKWKENNREKVNQYSINFRARQREQNEIEYLARQAEIARNYRKNHPKLSQNYNDNRIINMNTKYKTYVRDSNNKNIQFDLTPTQFYDTIQQSCYYCNTQQLKTLNGLSRLHKNKGYILTNIVPCCSTCNYIKYTHSSEDFYLFIITILSHQNLIEDKEYHYDVFSQYIICII